MVTAAAFRIFRSPVSTPVTISNLGIDLGVMAKLKPFSSTAVCVLLFSLAKTHALKLDEDGNEPGLFLLKFFYRLD